MMVVASHLLLILFTGDTNVLQVIHSQYITTLEGGGGGGNGGKMVGKWKGKLGREWRGNGTAAKVKFVLELDIRI